MAREESSDDTRRSFMKKGTLAATALAVGAGATGTYAGVMAQEEDEEGEIVIHGQDYYPEAEFHVLAQLETLSKNDFLENVDPDEEEFDDPDDWEVYPIRVEAGEAGPLGYIMVENDAVDPSAGDMGTMGETASFRDPDMNLLETDVTIEPDEVDDEVDDEPDDEVDDEPDDEVDDEPDDEVDDEPDDEVDDEPDDEVDDEPDDEVNNNNDDNDDGLF
ncbi:calcium-binding protein [Natrialbaceae archaeon AArc-T1-2]|uniref:calcium-binding protein n=1 Tax=Natrialbaceae archaeon AArc-T1-2 TaxID=3053904 RepID=UPI00255AF3B9|nr:calcium-binding protein [Natrialbaceae archaeon AArc-T1-2]WIV68013.1 calcium-binding protein [Natrialbaceae archaeon AArc-T1-2]